MLIAQERSLRLSTIKRGTQRAVAAILLCGVCTTWSPPSTASEHLNVLFVSVDDLRPELGCYGNKEIKTPHFDQFARRATTFTRAYCQAAVCAPSRASVMTGLRPDSTRVWDLRGKFRENLPDVVTIPQHFHAHGYHTVSMGKIFHNHMPDRVSFDEPDLRPAKYMTPELIDREPESFYYDEELNRELAAVRQRRLKKNPKAYADGWAYGRSTESFDAPDSEFYELWLLGKEGELVSLGSFRVGEEGQSQIEVPLPVNPGKYEYFDVSIQPENGSPDHSGRSVLRGSTSKA